jgi:hypothetical protein
LYSTKNIIQCEYIKKNEMGGACGTYQGAGTCVNAGLWWGNLRKFDHLEGLAMDGRIILKWILKKSV